MQIPPGLKHIHSLFPLLVLPPLLTYATLYFAQYYFGWRIHLAAYILSLFSSYPVAIIGHSLYVSVSRQRRANKMGAVLAPPVRESTLSILRGLTTGYTEGYPCDIFLEWSKRYGETYSFTHTEYTLFTTEPGHLKAILATQFEEFEKGALFRDQLGSLLGSGIFNADGDIWKFHRTMTRPFLSKEHISNFEILAKHSDEVISKITQRLSQGFPVDFQDVVGRFTLDSATEFLFGKCVNSLGAELPFPESSDIKNSTEFTAHPSNMFTNSFITGQDLVCFRARLGSFWWLREFWKDAVNEHRQVINDFVDPIIRAALVNRKADDLEKGDESFLEHMIRHTQDHVIIQDELINILVAGRDTTASTLTFSVHILSQRPDIVKRLRTEILEKVGDTEHPAYQQIRDMKYLRAFINGRGITALSSCANEHEVASTNANPMGQPVYVPNTTWVFYSPFLLHRRTDLWGPDVHEFDPDRFLDARLHKYLIPNPYIFIPFNAGPRICVGQQLAYNEVSFFLIRMLQRFDKFDLVPEAQSESTRPPAEWSGALGTKGTDKIRYQLTLTMSARGGMWVRMGSVNLSS